jgi:hypothetical protein
MTGPVADPASFRDPAGRFYRSGERILRTVSSDVAAEFEQLRASGLIDELVQRGWLISSDTADPAELEAIVGGRLAFKCEEAPQHAGRHLDIRVLREIMMQRGGAGLGRADDQKVGQGHDRSFRT